MMNRQEEIFDVVDTDGCVVGAATRSACHSDPNLLHQAVHVMVFMRSGHLVLQRRAPTKDIQPDKWDTSVGGHLQQGESVEAGAQREMLEELGIVAPLECLYRYVWRSDVESELISTFKAYHDGPYIAQEAEISAVRAWSPTEIDDALAHGVFTPNFELEWQQLRAFGAVSTNGCDGHDPVSVC